MSHAKGGVDAPNFTQCPNAIFEVMPLMSNSELRVVLAITRQTEGWHKESDELTVEQLMELTGLSNRAVIDGVQQGIERGIIKRKEKVKGAPRKGFMYSLVVNRSHKKNNSIVNEVHSDSERGSQPLVNEVHTQNKGKQTKQNKKDLTDEGANAAPPSPPPPLESSDVAIPDPVTANAVTTSPPIAPPPPNGQAQEVRRCHRAKRA